VSRNQLPVHPTMAQIAAEMGLSRCAVSSVVNGKARRIGLAEETVQRVREHLERRGYVPSRYARHTSSPAGRVVGIMHIDRIYGHVVEAFHRLSEELGDVVPALEMVVTPRERLEAAVRELRSRQVTDLVWVHNNSVCEDYRDVRIGHYLAHSRTTIYNYHFDSPLGERDLLDRGIALVGVDRIRHARQLARFLRRLGHRIIAAPDLLMHLPPAQPYLDAFTGAGMTVVGCPLPFHAASFRPVMARQGVTAIYFHGDSPACKAIRELRSLGVRIPEDLTVIGFDGTSRAFSQDLTTLAMPVEAMVAKVRAIVAGQERELRHCFDMELVEGRTHGPPANRGEDSGKTSLAMRADNLDGTTRRRNR
jgi:DNA-binding LacI/PurR family transcriptional regulator